MMIIRSLRFFKHRLAVKLNLFVVVNYVKHFTMLSVLRVKYTEKTLEGTFHNMSEKLCYELRL